MPLRPHPTPPLQLLTSSLARNPDIWTLLLATLSPGCSAHALYYEQQLGPSVPGVGTQLLVCPAPPIGAMPTGGPSFPYPTAVPGGGAGGALCTPGLLQPATASCPTPLASTVRVFSVNTARPFSLQVSQQNNQPTN